jgi:hypothetical protein
MLYFDILEPIRVLPDSDKGRLLVAMLEYGQDGIVPEFDGMLALAWGFVKPKIDRDSAEYSRTVSKRQYATFCRKLKSNGSKEEVSFDDWLLMSDEERDHMISHDITWYPTTTSTATTAPTATVTPSTTTKSTASATAAAAANGSPDDFSVATAAADRKLKMMEGELGKGVVALTDFQIDTLLDKMGLEMFDHYVAKLSNFIIHTGAQVKSHYATILKWWMEDSQDGGGQYESL